MEEKNELNDIILNRGGNSSGSKKVVMAIATLAIILIIVVVIMNRLNSDTDNLPQAVLPPEPAPAATGIVKEDPLFEPVEVIKEEAPAEDNLDRIAKKLKEESLKEEQTVAAAPQEEPAAVEPQQPAAEPVAKPAPAPATPAPKPVATGRYYIQVGSFTRYAPNARFLRKITDSGYSYTYHKVTRNGSTINKVLIGPFGSDQEARSALPSVRKNIEAGAFVTKV